MVWYYMLISAAAIVAAGLLVSYIRKRYIDVEMVTCPICGERHRENRKCPRCGGR